MLVLDELSSIKQTLGTKIHKKCNRVDILEGVAHELLAISMKVQRTKNFSQPIKFLESFVHSTCNYSIKHPFF
jgi:hypothetical protein